MKIVRGQEAREIFEEQLVVVYAENLRPLEADDVFLNGPFLHGIPAPLAADDEVGSFHVVEGFLDRVTVRAKIGGGGHDSPPLAVGFC